MWLRRNDRSDRLYCSSKCRMRALRQRRGQHPGCRPRGRPGRYPIPRTLDRAGLRRLASTNWARAEQAKTASADLQRRLDEQSQELAEARARIAELERLLAETRRQLGEQDPDGGPPHGRQAGDDDDDDDEPQLGEPPGGPGGTPIPRPRPTSPRPGVMELRRQLHHALTVNAELRAFVEELQRRIASLERRCAELKQQLQHALSLAEGREPPASGQPWDAESAARVHGRAVVLATELEQVRRERTETAEQRERLSTRLMKLLLPRQIEPNAQGYEPSTDGLFIQMRAELQVRERYADWQQSPHRSRERERRLDPTRTLDEQVLAMIRETSSSQLRLQGINLEKQPQLKKAIDDAYKDVNPERVMRHCGNIDLRYQTSPLGASIFLPSLGLKLLTCHHYKKGIGSVDLDHAFASFKDELSCESCSFRTRRDDWKLTIEVLDEMCGPPEAK